MTSNQISYWQLQEDKRSNRANEFETQRHNKVAETESKRHNVASEALSKQQHANDYQLGIQSNQIKVKQTELDSLNQALDRAMRYVEQRAAHPVFYDGTTGKNIVQVGLDQVERVYNKELQAMARRFQRSNPVVTVIPPNLSQSNTK